MRFSTVLLALPALAIAAQDQVPLKDRAASWFSKAKQYVPAAVQEPIDAGASKVVAKRVHKFTLANYEQKLQPSSQDPADGPEDWLIYVTGGNATCYGRCAGTDQAWNESVPILSALPKSPNFGILDCERQGLLCTTWAAGIPSLWLFRVPVPAPGQSPALTPLYVKPLNTSATTAVDIVKFYEGEEYLAQENDPKTGAARETYRYDGPFHPINGQLKVFGLLHPVGYAVYGFSKIPSFVFMILISFISRNVMGRRAAARPAPSAPAAGTAAQ